MKAQQLLLFSLIVFGVFVINILIPITAEAAVKKRVPVYISLPKRT
jgi:hypothetical protein